MDRTSVSVFAVLMGAVAIAFAWGTPRPILPTFGERAKQVLTVKATPQQGFIPLHLNVEIRQDVMALRGIEVCLQLTGTGGEGQLSCWKHEAPAVLVTRTLTIQDEGYYEVQAFAGDRSSNAVAVHAVGMERRK